MKVASLPLPAIPINHPVIASPSMYLVLALVGAGAAQPDLVLSEVGGNEGNDLAHGQALSRPEVPR